MKLFPASSMKLRSSSAHDDPHSGVSGKNGHARVGQRADHAERLPGASSGIASGHVTGVPFGTDLKCARHSYGIHCYSSLVDGRQVLRTVLTETGVSQSDLARVSGVKQPSISQFLSGRIGMSDEQLDRLLSCLGYRLEVIRRPVRVELDRSHHRSWSLHRQLATHLDAETLQTWIPTIDRNLARLKVAVRGEPHVTNLRRWDAMIDNGDLAAIRRTMTGLDTDSIQMREVSPLGGLLPQGERSRVLERVS